MIYLSVSLYHFHLLYWSKLPQTYSDLREGVHTPHFLMGGVSKNLQPFIITPCTVWPCQMGLQAGFGPDVAGSISEGQEWTKTQLTQ